MYVLAVDCEYAFVAGHEGHGCFAPNGVLEVVSTREHVWGPSCGGLEEFTLFRSAENGGWAFGHVSEDEVELVLLSKRHNSTFEGYECV